MLGVGWTEMLVIGVIALIVIGPKELPSLMRRVGQFAGTVRRMGQEFQRELNKTTGLNEITNLRNSVTQPLKATADAIRKEFNTTTASGEVKPSGAIKPTDPKVESVVDEIKAAAGMAPAPAAPGMTPVSTSTPTSPATLVAPAAAPALKEPVKAKRPARIRKPAESTVTSAELEPAKPVKKSAAPATAAEPAKPAASKKAAAKKPAAKPKAEAPVAVASKPEAAAKVAKVAKPATARKAATKAPTARKTT